MKIFYHLCASYPSGHYLQPIVHFATGTKWSYLIIILLILSLHQAKAQQQSTKSTTTLLTAILPEEQSKLSIQAVSKIKKLEQTKNFKHVQLVKVGNLAKIQKKGILSFKIPGEEKISTFYSREVTATSENDFTWVGTSESKLETAIFMSEKGKVYGSFSAGERHFQLFSVEEGLSVLLEERTDLNKSCGADGKNPLIIDEPLIQNMQGEKKAARQGVCTEPIRVLVLYTAAAQSSVVDINQTISLSIQQYNTTISNSGIQFQQTNQLQLAGFQQIIFTSNNPEATSDLAVAATMVRDNADVQNLRNNVNADIVVCLVEQNYGDPIGTAITIPASNFNYCAVVRAPFASATNFFTFTHEVGHLLGARHQNDPGGPAYAHGFEFFTNPPAPATSQQVRTIMHTFATSTRILHFSSPNVNFNGSPTGTIASNNVAKIISETSSNVVNFRPSVTQSFNAYIDGPSDIYQSGYYSWEALTFCRPWRSASWSMSYDGFNYGSAIAGGDALNYLSVDSYNNNSPFYLKCTFTTDQNQTYIVTKYVNVNLCTGCRLAATNDTQMENPKAELSSIYPNPSENSVIIDFSLDMDSNIAMEIIDLEGKSHLKRSINHVSSGKHQEELDVATLPNGVYVCRIKMGHKELSKRFIVSK